MTRIVVVAASLAGTQEVMGVEEGGEDVFWYDFSHFYFFLERKNGSNFDRSLAERGKGAPTFSHLEVRLKECSAEIPGS